MVGEAVLDELVAPRVAFPDRSFSLLWNLLGFMGVGKLVAVRVLRMTEPDASSWD